MEAVRPLSSGSLKNLLPDENWSRPDFKIFKNEYNGIIILFYEGKMKKFILLMTTVLLGFSVSLVGAAEIEVKMLNKDADDNKMVFEPMLIMAEKGDTVTFLPTEKGHMAASMKGMLPEGIKKFKGKINKKISVVVSEDGLYGIKCTPHFANGMVAIIAVGDFNPDGFLDGKKIPKKSKKRMEEMLAQLAN